MSEYSKIASGSFTSLSSGGSAPIYLPFVPQRVEWYDYTTYTTPAANTIINGYWDVAMGQGDGITQIYTGSSAISTQSAGPSGISTFSDDKLLQFGAKKQVVASTKGTSTSFEVTAHGYVAGDVVVFQGLYQSALTGMIQIATIPFVVASVTDANNFIIAWDTSGSNYTNLSGSPAGATVMKVLHPNLYIPGVKFITAITSVTNGTQISVTESHNFVVGQQVAFKIPSTWGTVELNENSSSNAADSSNYYYVTEVIGTRSFVISYMGSITAFNPNQPVASVAGQQFPQCIAVGDVNTGAVEIYPFSPLYPSPRYLGVSGYFNTINGPAIQGAFVNNTGMGFIFGVNSIGPSRKIYWVAYYDDYRVVSA